MAVWSKSAVAILLLQRGSVDRPTNETNPLWRLKIKAKLQKAQRREVEFL